MPAFLLLPVLLAQAPAPAPFHAEVAAAERAFARQAREQGFRAAFLAWLAPDSRVLQPAPDPGIAQYQARREDGSLLVWGPAHIEVAASGDLALSTGPWTWHPKPDAPVAVQGWFLSVWQRQPDGTLKVVMDGGTPQPLPGGTLAATYTVAMPPAEGPRPLPAKDLLAQEARLEATEAKQGVAEALRAVAAQDLRLYRPGTAPLQGLGAALHHTGAEAPDVTATVVASGQSRGGDLGYTVGTSRPALGPGHSFFRIWRAEAGSWKLIADLRLPLGPPAR